MPSEDLRKNGMGETGRRDSLRAESPGGEIRKEQNRRGDLVNISLLGILISLSSAIYVLETFIPFPLPVGRWGFSNSLVLFSATLSMKSALVVSAGKSILGSLLSGRIMSPPFWMGFLGSIGAAIVERLLYETRFGYIGMSLAGSAVNNVIQMAVGALIIKSYGIFSLLPLFLAIGSVSAVANVYMAKAYEKFWEVKKICE